MWAVKATEFVAEYPPIVTYFGPFSTTEDVRAFLRANTEVFHTVQTIKLVKPVALPSIHPNQAEISDYIDPSVAQ